MSLSPQREDDIRKHLSPGAYVPGVLVNWAVFDARELLTELDAVRRDREALQRRVAQLEALVRLIEYVPDGDGEMCAWCQQIKESGHLDDCPRQLVVAAPPAERPGAPDRLSGAGQAEGSR